MPASLHPDHPMLAHVGGGENRSMARAAAAGRRETPRSVLRRLDGAIVMLLHPTGSQRAAA